MKKNNQGFTLIELIIVIVILGILAVTAAPRFLDLQGDATESTLDGVEASIKSAVNIVNSKARAQGRTGSNDATTNPAVNVKFGYPDATLTEMQNILELNVLANNSAAGSTVNAEWELKTIAATSSTPQLIRIFPSGNYDNAADASDVCFVEYIEADTSKAGFDTPRVRKVPGC